MSNYWDDAELKARTALVDKSIDELNKLVRNEYLKASKAVLKDLQILYDKIIAEGTNVQASHAYQYNRLYEQLVNIQTRLSKLGVKEIKLFDTKLNNLYVSNWTITGSHIGNFSTIEAEAAEQAIQKIWVSDGKRFSDRIWTNKEALTEKLKETFLDGLGRGVSTDTLTKDLMKQFSASYNSARRLVRTELCHAAIQSTVDKYKASGITHYRFITASGCCEECDKLNGKVFPIDDTEHLPPLHPNGRCDILAVI